MTEEELAAIKARCEAATPGQWVVPVANVFRVVAVGADHTNIPQGRTPPYPWRIIAEMGHADGIAEDAMFIANARSDIPALLEVIDRLRDMVVDAQTEAEMQAAEVESLRAVLRAKSAVIEELEAEAERLRASLLFFSDPRVDL